MNTAMLIDPYVTLTFSRLFLENPDRDKCVRIYEDEDQLPSDLKVSSFLNTGYDQYTAFITSESLTPEVRALIQRGVLTTKIWDQIQSRFWALYSRY